MSQGTNLRRFLESQRDDVAAFLSELVRFPSTPGHEGPVIQHLYQRLKALADECRLVSVPESIVEDPDYSFRLEGAPYADRPNLYVRRRGSGGPSVVFNAHVDVVPPSQGQERPFEGDVREGVVYGRGACDAKGQVATLYLVLRALEALGVRLGGDIACHFVVEEECGGNGTLALVRQGVSADAAVVMEPTDLRICPSVRGAVWFAVTCYGRAGHSGRSGGVISALKEAVQAMGILEGYHDRLLAASRGLPLFDQFENPMPITIGQFQAGDWPATVPSKAVFKGVFGFLPNVDRFQVMREMREAIQKGGDEWLRENFAMDFIYRHDGHVLAPEHPLVGMLEAACRAAGREPVVAAMTASCDAWLYHNQSKIPTVVFGPGKLAHAHSSQEQIALDDIIAGAEVLVRFLLGWWERWPSGSR